MEEEYERKYYGKYHDLVKKEQKIVDKKLKENFLKISLCRFIKI